MNYGRRQFTGLFLSACLGSSVGCVTTPKPSLLSDSDGAEDPSFLDRLPWVGKSDEDDLNEPYPSPVKLAATWTPDTLIQVGRTPTRGFGGRVFFYNEKSQAVPVEGTLTIHGFDEHSEDPEAAVKRFVFTPEQLTRHFGQSDLGASYSIWLPWDAAGGDQRRVSLVTSFQAANGTTVQGIPATMLLPGKDTSLHAADKVAELSPQYQKYLDATRSGAVPNSGLTTTTIPRSQAHRPMKVQEPAISIPTQTPTRPAISGETKSATLGEGRTIADRRRPTFLPASSR